MSANLCEFEIHQLNLLIALVEEKIDDINYKIQRLEDLQPGDVKDDLMLSYDQEFDAFLLWKVQLQNALAEVKEIERDMSN